MTGPRWVQELGWRLARRSNELAISLLPLACLGCNALLARPEPSPLRGFCERCRMLVTLDGAASSLPLHGAMVFVRAAAMDDGPVAQALRALKFRHATAAARGLARLIASLPGIGDTDLWTFVPSSRERQRRRSTEVTATLAAWAWWELSLAKQRSNPSLSRPRRALMRTRETPPQRGLTLSERRDNVRGVFALRPHIDVSGARILLIDDVVTTGATLSSAATALLDAGAREVQCATLLRHV